MIGVEGGEVGVIYIFLCVGKLVYRPSVIFSVVSSSKPSRYSLPLSLSG